MATTETTRTTEAPAVSGVRRREQRIAHAEIDAGGRRWRVQLDGPRMGPMVLIEVLDGEHGWITWGTAVWFMDRLDHPTARIVDQAVTAALGAALLAALAQGSAS